MSAQRLQSLRLPIYADDHQVPLILRASTPSVNPGSQTVEGPVANTSKVHEYVLVSALPRELQEKIKAAVEMLSWG